MSDENALNRKALGIIVGGGALAKDVIEHAHHQGLNPHLILLQEEATAQKYKEYPHCEVHFGQIGKVFSFLEKNKIKDILFIGSISQRPSLKSLMPDWQGMKALPEIMKTMIGGDETVLANIASFFERRGYTIVNIKEIMPTLLEGENILTSYRPDKCHQRDIEKAFHAAKTCGALDMGQGAVSVHQRLIAMEGPEGTKAMLERCAFLRENKKFYYEGNEGVFAKVARPHQDLRFDMPTIGIETIDQVIKAGLSGIVIEAHHVLIAQREETIKKANENKIFIVSQPAPIIKGIEINESTHNA